MSLVENMVALLVLLITLIPSAQALGSILSKYRNHQERVEFLNLTENLSLFLQEKRDEQGEITLRYDARRKEYRYGAEIFPVSFLEMEEIRFYLEVGKIENEDLEWGELRSADKKMVRKFVRGGE